MGDDELTVLEKQHAIILEKIAKAEGAFFATGLVGSALLVVWVGVFAYAFVKLESHDKKLAENTQSIAVIKTKEIEYDRWREDVDSKLDRVVYKP